MNSSQVRTIKKFPQPANLTKWRATRKPSTSSPELELNYAAMRRSNDLLEAIEDGLLAEQGGICAYTGHKISITPAELLSGTNRDVNFHIEHLLPQNPTTKHLNESAQDTDYKNMVACWPRPNCGFEPKYGARKKDNWPASGEQADFISPLRPDCSTRFRFDHLGKIYPANANDKAAEATISKLGLGHSTLTALRLAAIRGALNPASRQIKLSEARKLLRELNQSNLALDRGQRVQLRPFCFAIEPALSHEIRKLEGIMKR